MNETAFASYADDNAPYTLGQNTGDVVRTLKKWLRQTIPVVH